MSRYIEEEKVLDLFHKAYKGMEIISLVRENGASPLFSMNDIDILVQSIPTADVKPVVKGEWRTTNLPNGEKLGYCNQCGWTVHIHDKRIYDFCPNCGADMRGENDVRISD